MASMIFELDVEMADGSTHKVVADQRDIARWEVQPFGWPVVKIEESVSMTFLRFLAWSAMTRQRLTALAWDAWNLECVEAMPLDDEDDAEDDERADPGQPAA